MKLFLVVLVWEQAEASRVVYSSEVFAAAAEDAELAGLHYGMCLDRLAREAGGRTRVVGVVEIPEGTLRPLGGALPVGAAN